MKKIILLYLSIFLYGIINAQIVVTEPTFITKGYTGQIKIIFDPSQGNKGMVGATKCFAHTGVNTTDGLKWQCAPTWRSELPKYTMTQENGKWVLIIDNMYDYYNCTTAVGKEFSELCFVFNDGTNGNKEGKTESNDDIYVPVRDPGLEVEFQVPEGDQLISLGTTVNFNINSSKASSMSLKINGSEVQTATGTTLTYSRTFSMADNYTCIVSSTAGSESAADTLYICAASAAASAQLPANALEGINYDTDPTKVTLVMYAMDKNGVMPDNVFLLGDFNNWTYNNSYQLKKNGSGHWWITLDGLTSGKEYAFQYAVKTGDNVVQISDAYTEKVLDPWNDKYISTDIYPGLTYPDKGDGLVSVFQTNKQPYNWSQETTNFIRKDKNNLIIYEMWIHDFSNERTIEEAMNRIEYLKELGVNAVELMPITEFDGNISWGYNPNHYFATDKSYGTAEKYKQFIDECHKQGIAVILDMVFNHSTVLHPFAKLYSSNNKVTASNPWYNVTAPHDDVYFEDYNHDFSGTKEYFKRVLKYWLEEYKVDGFRMDLTKGLCGATNCNNRVAVIKEYYDAVKSVTNDAYFILEHWFSSEEQGLVDAGMLCWSNVTTAYQQTAMGWLKSEGGNTDAFNGASRKGWVSYTCSHDEERPFYKAQAYGNGNLLNSPENYVPRAPLNLAFNIFLRGPKLIWQFEELAYDWSIDYDGRVSPKPLPEWYGWFQSPLRMGAYEKAAQAIRLRTELQPDIFTNGNIYISVNSGASVRTIQWDKDGTTIFIAGNFNVDGGTQYTGSKTFQLPAGTWYDYLGNNAQQAGGTNITLQPGELKIYTNSNEIVAPDIPNSFDYVKVEDTQTDKVKCIVYPTFVNEMVWIESSEPVQQVQVISLRGGTVKSAGNVSQINIADLQQGMYLVIVTFEKTQQAFKIIKQ